MEFTIFTISSIIYKILCWMNIYFSLFTIYKIPRGECFQSVLGVVLVGILKGICPSFPVLGVVLLGILKGICPSVPVLGVVLMGILNGIDSIGPVAVLVNLYGVCPVVPLGVRILGVKTGGAVAGGGDIPDEGGIPGICVEEDGFPGDRDGMVPVVGVGG